MHSFQKMKEIKLPQTQKPNSFHFSGGKQPASGWQKNSEQRKYGLETERTEDYLHDAELLLKAVQVLPSTDAKRSARTQKNTLSLSAPLRRSATQRKGPQVGLPRGCNCA